MIQNFKHFFLFARKISYQLLSPVNKIHREKILQKQFSRFLVAIYTSGSNNQVLVRLIMSTKEILGLQENYNVQHRNLFKS